MSDNSWLLKSFATMSKFLGMTHKLIMVREHIQKLKKNKLEFCLSHLKKIPQTSYLLLLGLYFLNTEMGGVSSSPSLSRSGQDLRSCTALSVLSAACFLGHNQYWNSVIPLTLRPPSLPRICTPFNDVSAKLNCLFFTLLIALHSPLVRTCSFSISPFFLEETTAFSVLTMSY